ncbi:hypothetical protein BASA81_010603 [Batrachochytrium salamandrivorans]|nr:hypothetical protein BASA81_010603 [Batrachochytrium salamandrivorans]
MEATPHAKEKKPSQITPSAAPSAMEGEEEEGVSAGKFSVGDVVQVESRTWPGMNKLGGVGRINKVNEDGTYGVTYIVLRGSERKVHPMFISHAVLDQGPRPIKEREYFHKEFPLRPSRKRGVLAASLTPPNPTTPVEEEVDEQEKKRSKKASAVALALALLAPVREVEEFAREQGDFPPLQFEEGVAEEEEMLPQPVLIPQVKVEVDEISQMMSLVDGEPSQGAIFVDETTSQAMVVEEVRFDQQPAAALPPVQVSAVETVEPVVVKPTVEAVVKSVVETTKPVEIAKPVVETTKPVVEIAKPVIETTELVKIVKPVVETTKPVEIAKPIVETTKPIVGTTKPIVGTTKPIVETTKPVVETKPVVGTAKPVAMGIPQTFKPVAIPPHGAVVDYHALERQALEQEFQREQSRLVERFQDSAKPSSSLLQQYLLELNSRFYPNSPTTVLFPASADIQAFKQQRDQLWSLQRARALALEELQRATSHTPQPKVYLQPLQAFCEI